MASKGTSIRRVNTLRRPKTHPHSRSPQSDRDVCIRDFPRKNAINKVVKTIKICDHEIRPFAY